MLILFTKYSKYLPLLFYAAFRLFLIGNSDERILYFDDVLTRNSASGMALEKKHQVAKLHGKWFKGSELKAFTKDFEAFQGKSVIDFYKSKDIHPPLYFLGYHYFSSIFGFTIKSGLILQWFLEILLIFSLMFFVRHEKIAIPYYVWVFIFLALPFTDAFIAHRHYALLGLLAILFTMLFRKKINSNQFSYKGVILLLISTVLGIATHFLFLLVVFSIFSAHFVLFRKIRRKEFILVSLVFLSIFFFVTLNREYYYPLTSVGSPIIFPNKDRIDFFLMMPFKVLLPGIGKYGQLKFLAWPVYLLILGFIILRSTNQKGKFLFITGFIFMVSFSLAYLLGKIPEHVGQGSRYYLFPFCITFLSLYCQSKSNRALVFFNMVGFALLFFSFSHVHKLNSFKVPKNAPIVIGCLKVPNVLQMAHLVGDEQDIYICSPKDSLNQLPESYYLCFSDKFQVLNKERLDSIFNRHNVTEESKRKHDFIKIEDIPSKNSN